MSTVVDVVVVSYNSRDTLRACVEHLAREPDVHVIVVDNDSPVESLSVVEDLPVTALRSGRNGGFSFGCNVGIAAGSAPYVMLLNPDAQLSAQDLRALVDELERDPSLGLAGPRILDDDGSLVLSQRRFPTTLSTFAEAFFLHRLLPRAAWAGAVIADPRAYEAPAAPDWVSGAAMLIRREVLERIGGMDEGFFLYSEDTDICARVRAAGFGIRYAPVATARHTGGQSAPRSALLPVMAHSRMLYASRHVGRPAALAQRAGLGLHATVRAAIAGVRRRADVVRGNIAALKRLSRPV